MAGDPIPFPSRLRARGRVGLEEGPPQDGERIRRSAETPQFIRDEESSAFHRTYSLNIPGGGPNGRLWLRCRVGRKEWLTDDRIVATREVFGWLCDGQDRIGAVLFHEWEVEQGASRMDFFYEMDSLSQNACDLAVAVIGVWRVEELSECGPFVEFALLWVHPGHAGHKVWLPAVERLIRRRYEQRFSVMLLLPFPLEYAGQVEEGSPLERGVLRRRRAMQRLCGRALGVQPLPGESGAAGWMWRPLRADVPMPYGAVRPWPGPFSHSLPAGRRRLR